MERIIKNEYAEEMMKEREERMEAESRINQGMYMKMMERKELGIKSENKLKEGVKMSDFMRINKMRIDMGK